MECKQKAVCKILLFCKFSVFVFNIYLKLFSCSSLLWPFFLSQVSSRVSWGLFPRVCIRVCIRSPLQHETTKAGLLKETWSLCFLCQHVPSLKPLQPFLASYQRIKKQPFLWVQALFSSSLLLFASADPLKSPVLHVRQNCFASVSHSQYILIADLCVFFFLLSSKF